MYTSYQQGGGYGGYEDAAGQQGAGYGRYEDAATDSCVEEVAMPYDPSGAVDCRGDAVVNYWVSDA
jgi:hypothetical protein